MTLAQKLSHQIEELPPPLQQEALDFVVFLKEKQTRAEEKEWSAFSLAAAVRGMEDEPGYDESDLKEKWF